MNGFFILEILLPNKLLFSNFQSFHLKQHLNYLNFSIQKLYTLLILTLTQPHTILNKVENFLGWMDNTRNSQSNSSQSETLCPHIIFSFDRKEYTIVELLTVFSVDFLNLIYLHNVIPPESHHPSHQSELV